MAVFTPLTDAEVERLLKQFSLGRLHALQGIAAGIENSNFFVGTDRGEFVLTVFERLTFAQLPFFLELMQHLARRGLPVPAPCETHAGTLLAEARGKPVAIVERMPGRSTEAPTPAQCAATGTLLANMHLAARDFPRFQPNLRGIGWWKEALARLEADARGVQLREQLGRREHLARRPATGKSQSPRYGARPGLPLFGHPRTAQQALAVRPGNARLAAARRNPLARIPSTVENAGAQPHPLRVEVLSRSCAGRR